MTEDFIYCPPLYYETLLSNYSMLCNYVKKKATFHMCSQNMVRGLFATKDLNLQITNILLNIIYYSIYLYLFFKNI